MFCGQREVRTVPTGMFGGATQIRIELLGPVWRQMLRVRRCGRQQPIGRLAPLRTSPRARALHYPEDEAAVA